MKSESPISVLFFLGMPSKETLSNEDKTQIKIENAEQMTIPRFLAGLLNDVNEIREYSRNNWDRS